MQEQQSRIQRFIENVTGISRYEKKVTGKHTNPEVTESYISTPFKVKGRTFAMMYYPVAEEGGRYSHEKAGEALRILASANALHDKPPIVLMFTKRGDVHSVRVHYKKLDDGTFFPTTRQTGGFGIIADGDAFWEILFTTYADLHICPVIVVPDMQDTLQPHGEGWKHTKMKEEPFLFYEELHEFCGKVYDGSLNHLYPELEQFTGIRFGYKSGEATWRGARTTDGYNLGVGGSMRGLPKIGDKRGYGDNEWVIKAVKHIKFDKHEHKDEEPYFHQNIVEVVEFVKCTPDVSGTQKEVKIVTEDLVRFASFAASFGMEVEAIKPRYHDKSPVTPWYACYDEQSGARIVMGWRWRVNEIEVTFAQPANAEALDEMFGGINTTKYVEGEWTSGRIPGDVVKKFTIHAHSDEDTKSYLGRLLYLARTGSPVLIQ